MLVSAVLAMSGSMRAMAIRSLLVVTDAMPPQDEHGRTNVLLLGVGDVGHDGANLTDAILIASVDPGTNGVSMLSIPRDLYLTEPADAGPGRVNTLYWQYKNRALRADKTLSDSGASLLAMRSLADEIGRRTGVSIQGVAKIDFSGFEQAIDSVGGIDVDVPEELTDYDYPLEEGRTGLLHIDAGPQHMSGALALQYARSRHSTSDFDRSSRQQQVLQAFARKVRGMNLLTDGAAIRSLQTFLRTHFESTLSTRELLGLGSMAASADQDRMIHMNLNYGVGGDSSDALAGGFVRPDTDAASSGAILLSLSLAGDDDDWGQIRTLAAFVFDHREAYLSHPRLVIDPSGAKYVQAQRLRNELLRYGFTVDAFADGAFTTKPPAGASARVVLNDDDDRDAAVFLAALLKLPAENADRGAEPSAIRIVLSKDYTFTPFQTLYETPRD